MLSPLPILTTLINLGALCHAHMQMIWPPPLRSKFNPHTTNVDYDMTNPLRQDGSDYPCKSYLPLLDTKQGQPVAAWVPGRMYNFSLTGIATHEGGSCQVSLSFDRGRTWRVIHSYMGNCPLKTEWNFTLPKDTPRGNATFGWTWFNNKGNREMYMNCAHVTIGGDCKAADRQASTPFDSRPGLFAANVGNGCRTIEGYDLLFPNPGSDVTYNSSNTLPPSGQCGAATTTKHAPARWTSVLSHSSSRTV